MEKEISMLFQILGFTLFFLLILIGLGRISDKVRYFFWFCSGVNIPLLKNAQTTITGILILEQLFFLRLFWHGCQWAML